MFKNTNAVPFQQAVSLQDKRDIPSFVCTGSVSMPLLLATVTMCVSSPTSSSSGPGRALLCVTMLTALPRACRSSCDKLTWVEEEWMLSARMASQEALHNSQV